MIKSRCERKFATICSLVSCVVFPSKYTNVQKKCIHSCKLCWFVKEQGSNVNFSPAGGAFSTPCIFFFPKASGQRERGVGVFLFCFVYFYCGLSSSLSAVKCLSGFGAWKYVSKLDIEGALTCSFRQDPDQPNQSFDQHCPKTRGILFLLPISLSDLKNPLQEQIYCNGILWQT